MKSRCSIHANPHPEQTDQSGMSWMIDRGVDGKVAFSAMQAGGRARKMTSAAQPNDRKRTFGIGIPLLISSLLLSSCSAPITYKQVSVKTPSIGQTTMPWKDAVRALDAAKAERDSSTAIGKLLDCARLAEKNAAAGDPAALALYNQSIGLLVARLEATQSPPWGRTMKITSDGKSYTLRGKLEPGAPKVGRKYVNVEELEFRGVYSEIRAKRAGLGAPLVAISPETSDFRKTFQAKQVHAALTAVIRFDTASSATLELYDPFDTERISLAGRSSVLAADFSAPVSVLLSSTRIDKLGLVRLLEPQKYSDTARLTMIRKYDPKRIPVLFVHGLDSTPATWTRMYNSLMTDSKIRDKYQFWFFSYPSGYPYPYSASLLRKELDGVERAFPGHKEMVIVGHSMGGMISRLMVTDANDRIWRMMFGKSPAETPIRGASRQLMEDALVFRQRKKIDTAIFIASPHRGSELSNHLIGRTFARLVRLPSFITDARNAFASVLTVDTASLQLNRAPSSVDTLSPNNRFVKAVNTLPIAPGITYHSVMGDRGKGDTPDSSDGVVPYWSSHLEGQASEKIVPSGHGAHENPEGIEEVRRILTSRIH